jgi:hypothetical protein
MCPKVVSRCKVVCRIRRLRSYTRKVSSAGRKQQKHMLSPSTQHESASLQGGDFIHRAKETKDALKFRCNEETKRLQTIQGDLIVRSSTAPIADHEGAYQEKPSVESHPLKMRKSRRPKIKWNGSPDSNRASFPERSNTTLEGWHSKPALQQCFVSIRLATASANTTQNRQLLFMS